MLRGYRSILAALAGLALIGAAQQPPQQPQAQASTQQTQSAPAPSPSPTVAPEPTYRPYPDYNADPCYRAENHDTADLCAQWRAALAAEKAAWWAGAAAILSFLTIVGLIVTIWQTHGALGEARRGNRIAQKANARATRQAITNAETANEANKLIRDAQERQLRPYVAITEDSDENAGQPFSRDSKITFRVKNFGQTPATNVRLTVGEAAITENTPGFEVPLGDKWGDYGLIAPGDSRAEAINARDMDLADLAEIAKGTIKLMARFRIDYTWPGGSDSHDVTMILADPATNDWTLVDPRRRDAGVIP